MGDNMKPIRWYLCKKCSNRYDGTKDNGCTMEYCSTECKEAGNGR